MRWRILALLFLARVGLGLQFQTLGSVSENLIGAFGFDYTEIGTLIGFFMLPGLLLAVPAGFAGQYLSDRVLVSTGLGAMAAGGLVAALADGFGLLALGRLACGAGFVVSTIFLTKMIADWFAGREIATAMSILVMSWPFGIALGQVGHEWLAAEAGWRSAFVAASVYCSLGALAVLSVYRPPEGRGRSGPRGLVLLTRRELALTVCAAVVWALFNAGYIVYLSFAPLMLTAGGYAPLEAAAVISLASWVMIISGAICGQIVDRSGRPDLVLYLCMAVAMASLALLGQTGLAVLLSLSFGLLGMAPAGVIMALTGEAMSAERRAFGMGVFFMVYFVITGPAPAIAGWLYDTSGDPYRPILFAVALFGLTAVGNAFFRAVQRGLPLPAGGS
jgi:MFS family permease